MTDVAPVQLSEQAARRLTERIRAAGQELVFLLADAHEQRAWTVLGYDSFRRYVEVEFGYTESSAWRMLDQARVTKALVERLPRAGVVPSEEQPPVVVSQRQAAVLKDHLDEAAELVAAGSPIDVVVKEIAERERPAKPRPRRVDPPPPPPPAVETPVPEQRAKEPESPAIQLGGALIEMPPRTYERPPPPFPAHPTSVSLESHVDAILAAPAALEGVDGTKLHRLQSACARALLVVEPARQQGRFLVQPIPKKSWQKKS